MFFTSSTTPRLVKPKNLSRRKGGKKDRAPRNLRQGFERLEERTMLSSGPFFMGLGDLPGGDVFSDAVEISNDGSTVVGRSSSALTGTEAFRWTISEGIQPLGLLDGASTSWANNVNYDGSLIVGWSPTGYTEAFRWTAATGMVELPLPPNSTDLGNNGIGSAFGVSDDGSIIVGYHNGVGPVTWNMVTGEIVALAPFGSDPQGGRALNVSGDGSAVVGHSSFAAHGGITQAFRWTEQTGTVGLGTFGDEVGVNTMNSMARAVSSDGEVVVGYSQRPLNKKGNRTASEAFRWTESNGMENLGVLPGHESSYAYAVSGDGSVVGGKGGGDGIIEAFIWDAVSGMRNLEDVLTNEYGIDLGGWQLRDVTDMSSDGRTLTGDGVNPQGFTEAWIAHLAPSPGITVTPTAGLETSEDGTSTSFDVVLDTEPTAPVTIDVSSSDESEGAIQGATASVLTLAFDATNWNVPQTVTVQGKDDAEQDGNQAYAIQLAPAVSTDSDYNGLDAADVSVTNLDNEIPPPAVDIVYAWDISHTIRNRGKHTDVRFTIDVNQDSNFDGLASSTDAAAANALVTVELYDSSDTLVGTYTGTTDSNGILRTGWIRGLDSGTYTAEVVDLALAGFDWELLRLDLGGLFNDDADGDGLPDEMFTIG